MSVVSGKATGQKYVLSNIQEGSDEPVGKCVLLWLKSR
jgi:hypothetical protein